MTRNDKITLAGLGLGVVAILITGTVLWARPVLKAKAEKAAAVAAEAAQKSAALARAQAERNNKLSRIMAEQESKRTHAAAEAKAAFAAAGGEASELIELTDQKGTQGRYGMEITGKVRSKYKRTLKLVSVRFSVFDSEGSKIGNASDYIGDLGSGEVWKFSASSSGKDGETYRLDGVWCSHGKIL